MPGAQGTSPFPFGEEEGALVEYITRATRQLANLKAAGAHEGVSGRAIAARLARAIARRAALVGSQQGIGSVPKPPIGGMSGAFMPDPASFLTPQLSAQYPEMSRILNAPSLLDIIIEKIGFGSGQNLAPEGPLPTPSPTSATARAWRPPGGGLLGNAEPTGNLALPFGLDFLTQVHSPRPSQRGPAPAGASTPTTPGGRPFFPMGVGITPDALTGRLKPIQKYRKPQKPERRPTRRPTRSRAR